MKSRRARGDDARRLHLIHSGLKIGNLLLQFLQLPGLRSASTGWGFVEPVWLPVSVGAEVATPFMYGNATRSKIAIARTTVEIIRCRFMCLLSKRMVGRVVMPSSLACEEHAVNQTG